MKNSVEAALAGHWIGTLEIAGEPVYCEVSLSVEAGALRGTMDLPFTPEMDLEVAAVHLEEDRVRFSVERPVGYWSFDGYLTTGQIQGTITHHEGHGTFQLAAVADQDPAFYGIYNGSYELAPDRVISIAAYRGEMSCQYPVCVDLVSGRLRALFPQGADLFVAGSAFLIPLPAEVAIEFRRTDDGQVDGLHWQETNHPALWAPRIAFRQEAVHFSNGAVTLAGTLTWPLTAGPHPAVVLIHGSGPQTRDHAVLRWIGDFFALNGVAVLAYDKRGVGDSTGDWNEATLEDLAEDALASVAYLQSLSGICPEKVGLWGISQGGWIAPLAAARSRNVAFLILVSGPGVSVAQQDVDRIELTLSTSGFSAHEVQAATNHQRMFFDALNGNVSWERLAASTQQAQEARWAEYVSLPTKERFDQRAPFLRRFFGYDPTPDLERVTCPVLALFGGRDIIVPPQRNVAQVEQALQRGGNADYTIRVFPTGDHVLAATTTGAMQEIPFQQALVPGYLDTVHSWLIARLRC
jgi:pimeloyl-ACP methyl ester carboxylesterase